MIYQSLFSEKNKKKNVSKYRLPKISSGMLSIKLYLSDHDVITGDTQLRQICR